MAVAQGPNRKAVGAVVRALRDLGRLEAVDGAHVQAAYSLAAAVDSDPGSAALWRQYREALSDLRRVDGGDDDTIADLLAEMQSAVGD